MERDQRKRAKQHDRERVTLDRKTGRMGMLLHRYRMLSARGRGVVGDPLRGQGRVLALLVAKPETTQRELSYLLDMRQQSLSELLAKLEDKGFVTREKSASDGRVTVVRLTEAGRAAAPSADEMGCTDDSFDCLTDEERKEYERLVDKITASLEERLVALGDDPYAHPHRHHGPEPHEPRDSRGPRPTEDGVEGRPRHHGMRPPRRYEDDAQAFGSRDAFRRFRHGDEGTFEA